MRDPEYITLDDGKLTVAAEFLPLLRAAGLDSFNKIMALPVKAVIRAVPGRSTIRVELPQPHGGTLVGYLKRYEEEYLSPLDKLLRLIRWPGSDDEAAREWRKMLLLRTHNFLTAVPIATGQLRRAGIVTSSFLLQQEIPNGLPTDDYIVQRLATAPPQRKWKLFRKLGELARTFQDAGFIHKDFYLKHVFVVERGDDWDLYLIDLQRVLGPRSHRHRWYLKDLSALAHSARRRARLSLPDILRIYLGYARATKLQAADKRFIENVWRRVRKLRGRQPRYGRVWNAAEP
jgi:tRNA A-37 threonylcarbamoyl transferase component Bud32